MSAPTITAISTKPATPANGSTKKVAQLTVEEELELAKKEAEENQLRIAQLEAEKKKRDEDEAIRIAKEQAEAEERKQFQAFKQFVASVGVSASSMSPVIDTPESTVKAQAIKEEVYAYKSEAKEPSGGLFGENTSYLIRVMGGTAVVLVVLYLAILSLFGKANDSVSLMFDSFPLRMYINLLIEVVAIGIGFIGLRLLFPEQYKYVHSKINSLCSPKQDWAASSPEFRLRFASEQLWRFAFLFVLALMVIFT